MPSISDKDLIDLNLKEKKLHESTVYKSHAGPKGVQFGGEDEGSEIEGDEFQDYSGSSTKQLVTAVTPDTAMNQKGFLELQAKIVGDPTIADSL